MGGKCADLNALYVGLARSVGLPARHVYGLRIAKSERATRALVCPRIKKRKDSTVARRSICASMEWKEDTGQTGDCCGGLLPAKMLAVQFTSYQEQEKNEPYDTE